MSDRLECYFVWQARRSGRLLAACRDAEVDGEPIPEHAWCPACRAALASPEETREGFDHVAECARLADEVMAKRNEGAVLREERDAARADAEREKADAAYAREGFYACQKELDVARAECQRLTAERDALLLDKTVLEADFDRAASTGRKAMDALRKEGFEWRAGAWRSVERAGDHGRLRSAVRSLALEYAGIAGRNMSYGMKRPSELLDGNPDRLAWRERETPGVYWPARFASKLWAALRSSPETPGTADEVICPACKRPVSAHKDGKWGRRCATLETRDDS